MKKILYGLIALPLALMMGCNANTVVKDVQPEEVQVSEMTSEEAVIEATAVPTEEPSLDIIPEEFAYSITVSINPLVELYFDETDTVVGVAYLNDDAEDAYSNLSLIGSSFEESIQTIV